ncbi:MAG: hypothetical protein QOJ50_3825 [Cryptosporangiaceae bacterium]|jgi:GAF domain-containing protein|nr:hypothetical protein [Cryptosporangiaceae bacterium]
MTALQADTLTALLAVRLDHGTLPEVLTRITEIVKADVTGADEVSVTLVRGDKPFTAAYTGQLALDADEMQYERGYGPCIDAGESATVMLVGDMRQDTRWPDYAAHVVPRGVLSSLSLPLPVQTEFVGALNCYARHPHAFSDDAVTVAIELAGHVAVAVANAVGFADNAKLAGEMRAAMASRAVIDQAIGVIMAQNHCDPVLAFTILRRASQNRNTKLRDIAQGIVASVAPSGPDPASTV